MCCGSWKCTSFPQKPPALPACRAICLAKTLVLSCRCRLLPVPLHRPAETLLLQCAVSARLHTQMSCEVILTRRDGKGNEFFRPARHAITPRLALVCIASNLLGPKPLSRPNAALPACDGTTRLVAVNFLVVPSCQQLPSRSPTSRTQATNTQDVLLRVFYHGRAALFLAFGCEIVRRVFFFAALWGIIRVR